MCIMTQETKILSFLTRHWECRSLVRYIGLGNSFVFGIKNTLVQKGFMQ